MVLEIVTGSELEVGGCATSASAQNDLVENAEQLPTLKPLVVQINQCQNWSETLLLIDYVALSQGLKRAIVLKRLLTKHFSQGDRARFLALLDLHVRHNPEDSRALKALELARKYVAEAIT